MNDQRPDIDKLRSLDKRIAGAYVRDQAVLVRLSATAATLRP